MEDFYNGERNKTFISWQLADDFMTAVFEKMGVPTEDARLCADVLLESDRRGIESHGCNRFKPIYIDRIKSGILNPVTKSISLKRHQQLQFSMPTMVWEW